MKIRDLVEVIPQPTVVRFEHLQGENSGWISDSYYITEETENHFKALKVLLSKGKGAGVFLIGHYGSGKSHFLAYLAQQLQSGRFVARTPKVATISLLNFRAAQGLESIVGEAVGCDSAKSDRRDAWSGVTRRLPNGLVLILDELSEFLRSKPTRQSFNEDLRFLQFLGEWAQERPLWIIAALQEQIEHTGEIEYDLFRKIKDRYPLRLLLTAAHVKDLISRRILRKRPGYDTAVEKLARELKELYPDAAFDFADFSELYPLHPSTLELLEEVRDRFSQARGIVDFALTQFLGNEARGIAPFLDRPWGHLLTPDVIVDHFSDLFEVQPEFLAIAQKILPYYRRHMETLFTAAAQRDLAWRVLKLLILAHLSPRREALEIESAAQWLLLKVSSVDPGKNREIVKHVLDSMCAEGAYLKRQGTRYSLDLQDDSKEYLEQMLARTVAELKTRGDYVFELLLPSLYKAEFNPFDLPRDRWHTRRVPWHFHDWDVHVYLGGGAPPEQKGNLLQIGLPWGPPAEGEPCYRILPPRLEITADILELAALHSMKDRPLPARVLTRVKERIESRGQWIRSLIRGAYNEAVVMEPTGSKAAPPLHSLQGNLITWLSAYGEWLLRQTYPQFERFAPVCGPLPKEAYRQFMKFALEGDIGSELAPEAVKLIREGYLLPMQLMQRRGPDYAVIPKLENHDLVRLLGSILGHHPSPARVAQHMRAPVYGLVPDQVNLLLLLLLIQGEIDIVKGDRSYRETYETLPNPLNYDKVLPGRALSLNQLHDLQILCEGFHIPVPKQWSVLAQKRAIEQLRKYGSRQRDQLSEFVAQLNASGEGESLAQPFETLISRWLALDKGDHELQGFEHFMFAIGNPQQFVKEALELTSLPVRYERLLRESRRFRYLFGYDCIAQCADANVAARLQALGEPPTLGKPADLEAWLSRAQDLYRKYVEWYAERHEQWRRTVNAHPAWNYRVPVVASSRHLGAAAAVREVERLTGEARAARCAGLSPMDFQPMCRCGFDGAGSPLSEILNRLEAAQNRLETDLRLFFQQDKVQSRMREWVEKKIEINPRTLSYLEKRAEYPQVENVSLLDQHLAGLELVESVRTEDVLELLGERVWEKSALVKALEKFFDRCGPRITLRREESAARKEIAAWCCEQALRQGCALPAGLSAAELASMGASMQPQWVSENALRNLDKLGLGEAAVQKVLAWLLDGQVRAPERSAATGPVAAALALLRPEQPPNVEALAEAAALLYGQHERIVKLRAEDWLACLDNLSAAELPAMPGRLEQLLEKHLDAHWVVVDCLGLPLLEMVRSALPDCFPRWKLSAVQFGLLSERSSTDAFYLGLIGRDFRKAFEKINAIDELIHNRKLSFAELEHLARAEIEIRFRKLNAQLDPAVRLVVFGDHGFRMAPDGSGFQHGGRSTLERIVPVFVMEP